MFDEWINEYVYIDDSISFVRYDVMVDRLFYMEWSRCIYIYICIPRTLTQPYFNVKQCEQARIFNVMT